MSDEATLAQLRQSLGLLQVAFDAASEAMVIVEPGGEVRWGNQAAADLWTNGLAIMLVGRRLEQLLQPLSSSSRFVDASQAELIQPDPAFGALRRLLLRRPPKTAAQEWVTRWQTP